METLITTKLHTVLAAALSGDQTIPTLDAYALWREFADEIGTMDFSGHSLSSLLRGLHYARDEYSVLLDECHHRSDDFCCSLAARAVMTLDSEIELVRLAVEYPHILQPPRGTIPTLFLANGFNQTHIVEIIKGCHCVRLLRRGDGSPATMADITALFEWAFNVEIPHVDQKAHNAVNRTKGAAQFLESMVRALEELGRR